MDYEEWRNQKGEWRDERRRWRDERREERRERWRQGWGDGRPRHGWMARGMVGLIFIALGALFLLSNLGIFYVDNLWEFWPVILIVLGVARAAGSRYMAGWISGGILILIGAVFLLRNFGYIHGSVWQYFWPLILILVGVSMLLRGMGARRFSRYGPPATVAGATVASKIDEWAMFGGVKRRVESQDFEGGEAFVMFGGIEIDLRRAGTKLDEVRIDANAMFGGVEIRVPETWEVVVRGAGIFGGYEDKSRGIDTPGTKRPRLIVSGQAVFGGVVIKN